jgi:hypothetical protein
MEPEMGLGDEAGEDGLSGLEDSQEEARNGTRNRNGLYGVRWRRYGHDSSI